MKFRKRRSHTAHQVVVSPKPALSDSEYKVFALQVAFRNGRAQISIHIMRSVVRVREVLAAGAEIARREIGFRAKDR
jgi:hypothetical protein